MALLQLMYSAFTNTGALEFRFVIKRHTNRRYFSLPPLLDPSSEDEQLLYTLEIHLMSLLTIDTGDTDIICLGSRAVGVCVRQSVHLHVSRKNGDNLMKLITIISRYR